MEETMRDKAFNINANKLYYELSGSTKSEVRSLSFTTHTNGPLN